MNIKDLTARFYIGRAAGGGDDMAGIETVVRVLRDVLQDDRGIRGCDILDGILGEGDAPESTCLLALKKKLAATESTCLLALKKKLAATERAMDAEKDDYKGQYLHGLKNGLETALMFMQDAGAARVYKEMGE